MPLPDWIAWAREHRQGQEGYRSQRLAKIASPLYQWVDNTYYRSSTLEGILIEMSPDHVRALLTNGLPASSLSGEHRSQLGGFVRQQEDPGEPEPAVPPASFVRPDDRVWIVTHDELQVFTVRPAKAPYPLGIYSIEDLASSGVWNRTTGAVQVAREEQPRGYPGRTRIYSLWMGNGRRQHQILRTSEPIFDMSRQPVPFMDLPEPYQRAVFRELRVAR
jgi:hypothetical protein